MKRFPLLISLLIMFSGQTQEFKDFNGLKKVGLRNGDTALVPYVKINQLSYTAIDDPFFKQSVGGKPIIEETIVLVKYDTLYLEIKFECRNNPRIDQNNYKQDNSPMYNQEVFEIFISQGESTPEKYLEIELNPNNALFVGRIFNNNKQFKNDFVDIQTSGIIHKVDQDLENNIWIGYIRIPRSLLASKDILENTYRLNFYRIISKVDQILPNWKVDENNATFACWSSTMTEKPQFHVPSRFGFLKLD